MSDSVKLSYFFVGILGSGMMPLALLMDERGADVTGSDRSIDAGRSAEKMALLKRRGIAVFPQDGSGISGKDLIVVASTAIEDTVPDMVAARAAGARVMRRSDLLAECFNAAKVGVAIGGTSGKSTATGMAGWLFEHAGRHPTIVNGAAMKNFETPDMPFASAAVGDPDLFVAEVDESDGSIAKYRPRIAVLNNVSRDHKEMDELMALFSDFLRRAETAIVNVDNDHAATAAAGLPPDKVIFVSREGRPARLYASDIVPAAAGVSFTMTDRLTGARANVALKMPGLHNVSNALGAVGAGLACGVPLDACAAALNEFSGIRRRLEVVGTAAGVTVIDDFAHNPDKISASLSTLKAAGGRLLVMFQPHGFGPLKLMKDEFIAAFLAYLDRDDLLLIPPPVYFGGTVERAVTSSDIVAGVCAGGGNAEAPSDRTACRDRLLETVKPGDRIVVMGARDDTLTVLARDLLSALTARNR
jgi:UDP-N-acetylmuramate--alanine ligase